MTAKEIPVVGVEFSNRTSSTVGFYAAVLTAVMTIVTFALAMIAIPISGANCREGCIEYPYLNTLAQYPRDYLWMYFALLLIVAFVALMASIHAYAPAPKKLLSQIGLCFSIISAVILFCDYFVQLAVVPVSLMNAETEGLPLLTQYNSHGIFIALEDLGYLLMSLAFVFMALIFASRTRLETAIMWIFVASFVLTVLSLAGVSLSYGLDRKDRFEVLALSINWLALLVNSVLLSLVFRRQLITVGARQP